MEQMKKRDDKRKEAGVYEKNTNVKTWATIAKRMTIEKLERVESGMIVKRSDETLTLPIHEHLQLHASQYKQKTQHPSHPLHKHTTYFNTPRLKKHYF